MGVSWDSSVAEIDRSTSVIDVNGDAKPDIVAHYYSTDFFFHTRLLLNRGDATFIDASSVLPAGPIGISFQTGDVDGDGRFDFVSASPPWVNYLRGLKPVSLSYFADPPAVFLQPVSQSANVGSALTLTVVASGYPLPAYQWQKNGVNIPGATGSSHTIPRVGFADSADYRVTITNSLGTTQSASAAVTVTDTFAGWRSRVFSLSELGDPDQSGPGAISNTDGLPNLVRYALGLDRSPAAAARRPSAAATSSGWALAYTRPGGLADVAYAVEVSTNLLDWSRTGVTEERVSSSDGLELWQAAVPHGSAPATFFRLRVSLLNEP